MRLRRRGTVAPPEDAEARFWRLVLPAGPVAALRPELGSCWLWGGSEDRNGYPTMKVGGRAVSVAVFAWSLAWGEPAPPGLRLERFACGLVGCVNPQHLRPRAGVDSVLGHRNLAAWNARSPVCVMGHPFTPANTIAVPGGRACRQCRRDVAAVGRRRCA